MKDFWKAVLTARWQNSHQLLERLEWLAHLKIIFQRCEVLQIGYVWSVVVRVEPKHKK